MKQLDPKAVWLFFFQFLLTYIILPLFLFVVVIWAIGITMERPEVVTEVLRTFNNLIIIVSASYFLIVGFGSYLWAVWRYNNYKYQITEEGVKIERGVISKHYITIPFERVQNIEIYRGILARILGLSELLIQTAGYSASESYGEFITEGRLPGLSIKDAEDIREELIKKVQDTKQGL